MHRYKFAHSILAAFGSLFNLGASVHPYAVASANDITRRAWESTGRSMRAAINEVDDEFGKASRRGANN